MGPEMMTEVAFLDRLVVHGFQIYMHGHIHQAKQGFYHYDQGREMHMVGAGTFGARTKDLVTALPWQYNLLEFEPEARMVTVRTRKKEQVDGVWEADARWRDKAKNPVAWYEIKLR